MSECYVYVLTNPITRRPFYVGVSNNPWYRFYSHQHDRCSAVWDFLNFLTENMGLHRDEILKIYRRCASRREAFDLEYQLVTSTSGLLNRPYKRGRSY